MASSIGPPLKEIYYPNKSSYKNYLQQINWLTRPAYSAAHYHPVLLHHDPDPSEILAPEASPLGLSWHGVGLVQMTGRRH